MHLQHRESYFVELIGCLYRNSIVINLFVCPRKFLIAVSVISEKTSMFDINIAPITIAAYFATRCKTKYLSYFRRTLITYRADIRFAMPRKRFPLRFPISLPSHELQDLRHSGITSITCATRTSACMHTKCAE